MTDNQLCKAPGCNRTAATTWQRCFEHSGYAAPAMTLHRGTSEDVAEYEKLDFVPIPDIGPDPMVKWAEEQDAARDGAIAFSKYSKDEVIDQFGVDGLTAWRWVRALVFELEMRPAITYTPATAIEAKAFLEGVKIPTALRALIDQAPTPAPVTPQAQAGEDG